MTLPSPVGHSLVSRNPLVIQEYHLYPKSELASMLEPGKKDRIRINHRGVFGGEGHRFLEEATRENEPNIELVKKHPRLVLGRTEGTAIFTVLPSLHGRQKFRPRCHSFIMLVQQFLQLWTLPA